MILDKMNRDKNNPKQQIPAMIMISNTKNESYQDAILFDVKKKELVFESSLDPKPGSDLTIRIEDDVPGSDRGIASKSCRARVKWCREHLDGYTFNYRIGVQLSEAATCFNN